MIHGYLDELADRERFDISHNYAALFPVEVISAMLAPPADRQQIRLWTDEFLFAVRAIQADPGGDHRFYFEMAGYFLDLARQKRQFPTTSSSAASSTPRSPMMTPPSAR